MQWTHYFCKPIWLFWGKLGENTNRSNKNHNWFFHHSVKPERALTTFLPPTVCQLLNPHSLVARDSLNWWMCCITLPLSSAFILRDSQFHMVAHGWWWMESSCDVMVVGRTGLVGETSHGKWGTVPSYHIHASYSLPYSHIHYLLHLPICSNLQWVHNNN